MFSNKVQNDHSGKFLLFFNPRCRLIQINIEGQWECSIIGKIFTVTQVIYTITKHCEFTVVSHFQGNFHMFGLFIQSDSVFNEFIFRLTASKVGRQVGIFSHNKYLQIMKELKICKYTKNTKKQINTEFMAGMTQKELKQPYFHCGPF